ncbi:CsbD-like protein [Mycolicibacterium smegmatis MKD8]|uniref:CsbD-like protein n=2 Tax=Mycolicibacterium smegmatis TaxID=1772 RepID=A0A2U9PZF3_MYCSE|nr:CsbD family protein [Mycolicibacterium smegmatis]AWT56595.1 CsbD-like protein [Mycolicibacterium smegmatis MKD8]
MSGMDKAKNKAQHLIGQAKEAAGKATGHRSTERHGHADQAKAHLHDAGEKVGEKVKGTFDKLVHHRGGGPARGTP